MVVELTGEVEAVDHLAARRTVRLLLAPDDPALPPLVRVSVDEDKFPPGIAPGAEVRAARASRAAAADGAARTYDFARDAWFKGIGAVGKALGAIAVDKTGEAERPRPCAHGLRQHVSRGSAELGRHCDRAWRPATRMRSNRPMRRRCGGAA